MQRSSYATYLDVTPDNPLHQQYPDLDYYSVTVDIPILPGHPDQLSPFLTSLLGEIVLLSNNTTTREAKEIHTSHIILSFHPVILSVSSLPGDNLKQRILLAVYDLGLPCFPSNNPLTLTAKTRNLPTSSLIHVLREVGLPFLTVTNYGMKIPFLHSALHDHLPLLSYCSAHRLFPDQYPMNSYDISFACRDHILVNIKLDPHSAGHLYSSN